MAPDLLHKVSKANMKAMNSPELRERIKENGGTLATTTPQEFGNFIRSEIARWAPIIKASGARVD